MDRGRPVATVCSRSKRLALFFMAFCNSTRKIVRTGKCVDFKQ